MSTSTAAANTKEEPGRTYTGTKYTGPSPQKQKKMALRCCNKRMHHHHLLKKKKKRGERNDPSIHPSSRSTESEEQARGRRAEPLKGPQGSSVNDSSSAVDETIIH
jgi:hypothetical protein